MKLFECNVWHQPNESRKGRPYAAGTWMGTNQIAYGRSHRHARMQLKQMVKAYLECGDRAKALFNLILEKEDISPARRKAAREGLECLEQDAGWLGTVSNRLLVSLFNLEFNRLKPETANVAMRILVSAMKLGQLLQTTGYPKAIRAVETVKDILVDLVFLDNCLKYPECVLTYRKSLDDIYEHFSAYVQLDGLDLLIKEAFPKGTLSLVEETILFLYCHESGIGYHVTRDRLNAAIAELPSRPIVVEQDGQGGNVSDSDGADVTTPAADHTTARSQSEDSLGEGMGKGS